MKTDNQRFDRAAKDVQAKLQQAVESMRFAIGAKHQLHGQLLELALTKGVGLLAISLAKQNDVPLTAQNIEGA